MRVAENREPEGDVLLPNPPLQRTKPAMVNLEQVQLGGVRAPSETDHRLALRR